MAYSENTSSRSKEVKRSYPVYHEPSLVSKLIYDTVLWVLSQIFDCFFREIKSRGRYKIPRQGPVIFVAAPHANQFVDPVILMDQVRKSINKRVSFLIAAKSLKRPLVGFLARCIMSIGVERGQDNLKTQQGKITVDPENPLRIIGHGTHFLSDFKPKGLIGLPKSLGYVEIQTIESDTVLTIRKEFKMEKREVRHLLTKGTSFKYAPKVDQSFVYQRVFDHLAHNGSIGIFPEGGSHDRTDLLPLKAGVAIMALGCMDKYPGVNVKIVPCGMNYFHPHKFRSRAVVEFGDPIEIPNELVKQYRNPETNKEAVKTLLDTISESLKAVTVICPDYETLMVVQAMRRLYTSRVNERVSLPMVVEMRRRIVRSFQTYKENPQFAQLKQDILNYNAHLSHYDLPDHLVETARINFVRNLGLLIFRSMRLVLSLLLALPGIVMFSPVFLVAKYISKKKAAEALANSTVKINAKDVIATWKILIGMGFAPLLYILWSLLFTYYLKNRYFGTFVTFCLSYFLCAAVTYSALIVGDIGMDIFKSLKPLYLSLLYPQRLKKLQKERQTLSERITDLVNSSYLFPKYETEYEESDVDEDSEDRKTAELKRRRLLRKKKAKKQLQEQVCGHSENEQTQESDAVSLLNSDNSLSNIPFFSNSLSKSRSSTVSSSHTSVSDIEIEEKNALRNDISSKITNAIWNKRHEK